ncbi:MAG: hypothetical protein LQ343_007955 [Gyalolechia ehrenbergii]|nr:MAG: hypothetical protein LQ343_007955 [Gyalolechia ehrenbergii]
MEDEGLYILRIRLYVLRQFEDRAVSYGHKEEYGDHDRIRKFYGKPDLQRLIQMQINEKRGQLLISTIYLDIAKLALAATDAKMQDQIRGIVQRHLVKGVRIVHLAFEPYERRWWYTARLNEVRHQGVV